MQARETSATDASTAVKSERDIDYALEGRHTAKCFDGDKLEPGMTLTGPAIVEDAGTTVVIHPGDAVSVDGYGNLHIVLAGAAQ